MDRQIFSVIYQHNMKRATDTERLEMLAELDGSKLLSLLVTLLLFVVSSRRDVVLYMSGAMLALTLADNGRQTNDSHVICQCARQIQVSNHDVGYLARRKIFACPLLCSKLPSLTSALCREVLRVCVLMQFSW